MGEAKRRGSYEERKKKAIEEGSSHPKKRHFTQRMVAKAAIEVTTNILSKIVGTPKRKEEK